VNITYIAMDNEVYGMTKGQASPTTPIDWKHSKLTPHGTGQRPFKPAAVALSAGATWIARGYSGDPNGIARLLAEAIAFEGFSFLHVLSQCITFCPEQTDWKSIVREYESPPMSRADEAAAMFLAEDGFSTGLLYRDPRGTWPLDSDRRREEDEAVMSDLRAAFALD
jgi:2-oxoglutarate ferredoxin oxidoreductase subunit beta